jgi:hypothetical protein
MTEDLSTIRDDSIASYGNVVNLRNEEGVEKAPLRSVEERHGEGKPVTALAKGPSARQKSTVPQL